MNKCLLSAFAVVLIATSAWAGAGFYGTGGFASGKWNNVISSGSTGMPRFFGGGIIVDSAVAEDTLLSYRFKAGYERIFLKMEDTRSTFEPIHRLSMSHTIGMGLVRTEHIRFWIGPRLGLHYFKLTENAHISSSDRIPLYLANGENSNYLPASTTTVRRHFIGLDMLPAMGINFNFGDHFTLLVDMGKPVDPLSG